MGASRRAVSCTPTATAGDEPRRPVSPAGLRGARYPAAGAPSTVPSHTGDPNHQDEASVTAFGFDLSKVVKPGDNLIAVRTDNRWDYREHATNQRYQWADKNFNANYGGLPKNLRTAFVPVPDTARAVLATVYGEAKK